MNAKTLVAEELPIVKPGQELLAFACNPVLLLIFIATYNIWYIYLGTEYAGFFIRDENIGFR